MIKSFKKGGRIKLYSILNQLYKNNGSFAIEQRSQLLFKNLSAS